MANMLCKSSTSSAVLSVFANSCTVRSTAVLGTVVMGPSLVENPITVAEGDELAEAEGKVVNLDVV